MTKKFFIAVSAGMLLSSIAIAQTLFTYGNNPVTEQEFLRAFEKNPDPGNRQQAMKEYLPLYINYKLKVKDALDKKMDTLPNQLEEYHNYRNQLAETFINDKANTQVLVQEAFERSQKDIKLGHLFIGFNPVDSAGQKTAETMANEARKELLQQKDFAGVVNKYSTDAANKAAGGVAGWITAFTIPYLYESAVYQTPVGDYTPVMKSANGYHIFKNMGERPARGQVRVAQIMLINTDKGNPQSAERIHHVADSVYAILLKGAPFDSMAAEYSNDRTSYNNGGVLPEFGVGQYSEPFENQAFALAKPGDISQPFETSYGWHILKLIDKRPVPAALADADINGLLQQQVLASGRSKLVKDQYIESQLPRMNFKKAAFQEKDLWAFADSSMSGADIHQLPVQPSTVLFSFNKQNVTANDWLQYVKTEKMMGGPGAGRSYDQLMKDYIHVAAEKYLVANLEKTDPDFTRQLKEFREANLLFEAMDKNVWSKAVADSAALAKYYNEHKDKYRWGPSATALLVTATDSSLTSEVRDFVQSNLEHWHELSEKFPVNLIADSGRYELSQLPAVDPSAIKKGMVTKPVTNEMDGSQTFAAIFEILPGNEQRSFEEARGFVINDYQQVLEDKWIASLKKQYPVKINEATWQKLLTTAGR